MINAAGADERGRGQAAMVLTATLAPRRGSGTKVNVAQDLQISGAAAQYGRGMITDVTNVLVQQFARNAAERHPQMGARRGTRGRPGAARPAASSIGLAAAMAALKRVFWRFFGSNARRRAAMGG